MSDRVDLSASDAGAKRDLTRAEVLDGEPAAMTLDPFWTAVRRLPKYLKFAVNLARDDDVPRKAKTALILGGVYTISPVDLVPGIIPVAGQLDDLLVLLFALRAAMRACPPDLAAMHLERAGLTGSEFDEDLTAAKETAKWLARAGYKRSRALARQGAGRLATMWREQRGGAAR
jgi:uncharacterized membrane protein YkvA (DUF1232 family)